ncbi:hypothetical protein O5853_32655, partial [Escherichia coli]|nr:hypothetical protein [Escherichia coli]
MRSRVQRPSHLEIVSPVVSGSVRARLDRLDEPSSNKVLPARHFYPKNVVMVRAMRAMGVD